MTDNHNKDSFEDAADSHSGGLISDFFGFMKENAKWWLIPFVIVFGLLGVLLLIGGSGAAPFIYTLF